MTDPMSRIVQNAVSAAEKQVVSDQKPSHDLMAEGARMFSDWGTKLKHLWKEEHYSHLGFKVNYITKIFKPRADNILGALALYGNLEKETRLDYDYRGLFEQLLREWSRSQLTQDRHVTVNLLSFGCGPGSDCVAQILFWRLFAAEVLGLHLRFKVTCVDTVPSWLPSLRAALGKLTTELDIVDTAKFIPGSWDTPSVLAAVVRSASLRQERPLPHRPHSSSNIARVDACSWQSLPPRQSTSCPSGPFFVLV